MQAEKKEKLCSTALTKFREDITGEAKREREGRIDRFSCLQVLLHRLPAHTDVENSHLQERSPIYGFDTFPKRNSPKQERFHGCIEK